ncbi:MAG: 50S ribosomal protein L29 [Puniceicoccales bacterium]|jgi:ribosomal protein L29|nr:50S ribosomal protein L29 [Puniceicoccales bacterium]
MKKIKEMRSVDTSEIVNSLREKRRELLRLHLRQRMEKVEKTHQFPSLRRDIARMETLLRERSNEGRVSHV